MRTFRNLVNESDQERKRFSILKARKAHPQSMAPLNVTKNLSAQKKADVKCLMAKQFGDDWEKDETFAWYKKILCENSPEAVDSDVDVLDNHDQHDHDSSCDCLEPEIAIIV